MTGCMDIEKKKKSVVYSTVLGYGHSAMPVFTLHVLVSYQHVDPGYHYFGAFSHWEYHSDPGLNVT